LLDSRSIPTNRKSQREKNAVRRCGSKPRG
jgi:hypothetical protein